MRMVSAPSEFAGTNGLAGTSVSVGGCTGSDVPTAGDTVSDPSIDAVEGKLQAPRMRRKIAARDDIKTKFLFCMKYSYEEMVRLPLLVL